MSGELLLELLSEEIPARMQRQASEDLARHLGEWLKVHRIPTSDPIQAFVTPRRLVVIASGIPTRVAALKDERRGPRVGAPQAALDGFLRSVGLGSIEDCEICDTGRGEFYFAIVESRGRDTVDVLPDLIYSTICSVEWPKSMRFPATELRWVRPLNSVICLFDGNEVSLTLGKVPVGRVTRGHRFLSPGEISVADAADYRAKLAQANVVLDRNERRAAIAQALDARAAAEGMTVKPDEGLLEEVTGLVEYPVVLSGTIDADFMDLPPEVLSTSMRTHQKYFSVLNPDGSPAPRFLFVANNRTEDGGAAISAGNERVLRARLSDARFFWDQDRKVRLEDRVDALKDRVFHAKLGSVYQKVERVERLAEALVPYVPGADAGRAKRAARLAKADLSTGMVGEFPELQGVMGRYYARNDGEPASVADAIADHYKPLGPSDTCPTGPDSIAVALADKIDTLVAFFSVNEAPTGSRDPYALRRAALGMIRMVLENSLRLPLMGAFQAAGTFLKLEMGNQQAASAALLSFVADRLKVHLRDQGIRHDLITAAFEQVGFMGMARTGQYADDLVTLLSKVAALKDFLDTEDGANLLIAYRRSANIVGIEQRKTHIQYGQEFDAAMFRQPEEEALARRLSEVWNQAKSCLEMKRFEEAMASLSTLRHPIDEFFGQVTVNTEDNDLRTNRLRLLTRIRNTMDQIADFSQIEG